MPRDGHVHALQGEAALVRELGLAGTIDDLRVDDGGRLVFVTRLEDEEPLEDANLRRGESDTAGVVHELGHPVGEADEVLVEAVDLVRAQPQHRIGVLPDLGERHAAPRLDLGVELLVDFVGLALVVGLLVHLRRGHRPSVTPPLLRSVTRSGDAGPSRQRVRATADRRRRPH